MQFDARPGCKEVWSNPTAALLIWAGPTPGSSGAGTTRTVLGGAAGVAGGVARRPLGVHLLEDQQRAVCGVACRVGYAHAHRAIFIMEKAPGQP